MRVAHTVQVRTSATVRRVLGRRGPVRQRREAGVVASVATPVLSAPIRYIMLSTSLRIASDESLALRHGHSLRSASMPVLRPDEQVLQMMLDGWRNQQLSRNLQFATIEQRLRHVRRFIDHVNADPWNWTPTMVEEFSADLRAVKHVAHSTLRGYHSALRAFTSYISNPDYGWDRVCEQYFGTHPSQVFFDWNTAPHVQAYDGRPAKRPYTRKELDALFEHADMEVERIGKSGRKGWQAAYRDAVMMKIAYGYGLRFNELRHLQTVDFARNPHAREFGAFGVCKVRYGKSRRSSPYKGRSVLTVWRWTPGVLEDWLANGRGDPGTLDLFPSERGGLVVESTLLRRLRRNGEDGAP